jgi:hypothetical protein
MAACGPAAIQKVASGFTVLHTIADEQDSGNAISAITAFSRRLSSKHKIGVPVSRF